MTAPGEGQRGEADFLGWAADEALSFARDDSPWMSLADDPAWARPEPAARPAVPPATARFAAPHPAPPVTPPPAQPAARAARNRNAGSPAPQQPVPALDHRARRRTAGPARQVSGGFLITAALFGFFLLAGLISVARVSANGNTEGLALILAGLLVFGRLAWRLRPR